MLPRGWVVLPVFLHKQILCTFVARLSVGNDVSLSQQLDKCNNNVPDGDAVVLPSAPRSKTSSNSSSPSPSLRSSPSSSPLSPSTSSSSSDAVSLTATELRICLRNLLSKVAVHKRRWRGGLGYQLFCVCRTLTARRAKQPSSRPVGARAPTGKSLPPSVITGHRATLPTPHLETPRGGRYAQFGLYTRQTCKLARPAAPRVGFFWFYMLCTSITRFGAATSHRPEPALVVLDLNCAARCTFFNLNF